MLDRLTSFWPVIRYWGLPVLIALTCFFLATYIRHTLRDPMLTLAKPDAVRSIRVQSTTPPLSYTVSYQPNPTVSPALPLPLDPALVDEWLASVVSFPVSRSLPRAESRDRLATIEIITRQGQHTIHIGAQRVDMQTDIVVDGRAYLVPTATALRWLVHPRTWVDRQLNRHQQPENASWVTVSVSPPHALETASTVSLIRRPLTGWWCTADQWVDPDRVMGVLRLMAGVSVGDIRPSGSDWDATFRIQLAEGQWVFGLQWPQTIWQALPDHTWGQLTPVFANMLLRLMARPLPDYPLRLTNQRAFQVLVVGNQAHRSVYNRAPSGHWLDALGTNQSVVVQSFLDRMGQLQVASPSVVTVPRAIQLTLKSPTQSETIWFDRSAQGWRVRLSDGPSVWVMDEGHLLLTTMLRLTGAGARSYNATP